MEPKRNYGRMITGELLTDELIEQLSREAEKGWDVEELLTWRDVTPSSRSGSDARARIARQLRPRRRR
jgi:uncharacterized membrane protein YheB (UPF0754 family)